MPTKSNVRNWFGNFKDKFEDRLLEIEDKLKEASSDFADRITDPETKKDKKMSAFARKLDDTLDSFDKKREDLRTKIISNDNLRTVAVAVCEKLIDKAKPQKDVPFKISLAIVAKLTKSLELCEPEYGETISDDKILSLAEKMMKHPEFQQEGEELLNEWQQDNANELDMNEELIRAHEEPLPDSRETEKDSAEIESKEQGPSL